MTHLIVKVSSKALLGEWERLTEHVLDHVRHLPRGTPRGSIGMGGGEGRVSGGGRG